MKHLLQRIVGLTGYELHRKDGSRGSVEGVFRQLRSRGFAPAVVVDAGAAFGDWTRMACRIFPEAAYYLFEPLEEYASALELLPREFPDASFTVKHELLASAPGEQTMRVHRDLVGSSVYEETEDDSLLVSETRSVPASTVDEALAGAPGGGAFLKVDAQGAELEVLKGATATLARTEVIQLEVSLLGSIQGAPLFDEVIAWLSVRGFVPYDLTSFTYRPLDGALAQADIIFVRADGAFRKESAFATPEQRRAQNERFAKKARERLAHF
jgi:FkbM family methyltransferase